MSDQISDRTASGKEPPLANAGSARRGPRLAVKVAISILIGAGAFELASNLVFLAAHHKVFYFRGATEARQEDTQETIPPPLFVLHPVLGFIHQPGLPMSRRVDRRRMDRLVGVGLNPEWSGLAANNYGFFASEDYPAEFSEETVVIAVFGGSVAQWFALQGGPALVDELRRLAIGAGRPFVVLNFGQGGFKQPQQLIALQYFLALGQRFDLVINLDGFNEVALSQVNNKREVATSMPSIQHIGPLVALVKERSFQWPALHAMAKLEGARRAAKAEQQQVSGATTASSWLVHSALLQVAESRIPDAAAEAEAVGAGVSPDAFYHINPRSEDSAGRQWGPETARMWAECSLMMSSTLAVRRIPFLEVVQPNQYVGDHRVRETERHLVFSERSPYRPGVEEGYPLLEDRLLWLRDRNVAAVSAVHVFDGIEGMVYSDDCCHLNQAGNEILAGFIAHEIRERWPFFGFDDMSRPAAAQSK